MITKKVARVALAVILLLLALAASSFLTAKKADAAEVSRWNTWDVAPYAHTFGEACKKASLAIDGFDMPSEVKQHFKQVLGSSCKGGTEMWLTPHQTLKQMWSGGQHPHVATDVMVGELPVLKSPDGRPYRKGSVAETAKAFSWTWTYEGKTYVLYLPFVCFNWSWTFGPPPTVVAEECVEVVFNAPADGHVRWGVGTTTGPLPPDKCNAQRQGDDGVWMAWYGECDICAPALDYIDNVFGSSAAVPHKYLYPTIRTRQTLRFTTSVWNMVLYICLEDVNGLRTCGVYVRPQDWKGRYHVEISDSLWLWDEKNCPK